MKTKTDYNDRSYPYPNFVRLRKGETRQGRCYEMACRTLMGSPEWTLVHGSFRLPNQIRYAHAWLELGDFLHCAVWGQTFPMDVAKKLLRPRVWSRYTADEARHMVDLIGFFSPPWPRRRPARILLSDSQATRGRAERIKQKYG